jgi:hypothetical protein
MYLGPITFYTGSPTMIHGPITGSPSMAHGSIESPSMIHGSSSMAHGSIESPSMIHGSIESPESKTITSPESMTITSPSMLHGSLESPESMAITSPDRLKLCLSIAHNIHYITDAYNKALIKLQLPKRYVVVGHGRSGKDTVASMLCQKLRYNYGGSTSSGTLPLVCYSLYGRTDIPTQQYCYDTRHQNRAYWYDFCNLLRIIDPLMLLKLTLSQTDVIVGTRSEEEFVNSLDYFKPTHVVWVDRKNIPPDPTLEFNFAFCMQESVLRGVRCTSVGNNDTLDVLSQQIDTLIGLT